MSVAFQSNTINNFLSTFTSFMNSQVSENVNESLANCSALNIAKIVIGDSQCRVKISNSEISVLQNAKTVCNLSVQNQTELYNTIKNGIENNITQLLDQNNKSVQDFLALGSAALQLNKAEVVTQITNDFVNSIRQSTTNVCQSIFQATNNGTLILPCSDIINSKVFINQDATVIALTSCVNNILQSATAEGTALNKTLTTIDQYQESEQKGLGSVLMWITIIGGIILLLILIGAGIWFFFLRGGGGGGSTTQIYAGNYGRTYPIGAYQFAQP